MRRSLIVSLLALPVAALHSPAFAQSVATFDGQYFGTMTLSNNPNNKGDCGSSAPSDRTLSIQNGGSVAFLFNAAPDQRLSGTVSADGTITAFGAAPSGGKKLTGRVQGNTITGEVGSASCQYSLHMTKMTR